MDLGLKDKVAIVTGSSRGIGRSIAMGLAIEGCKLIICARGEKALEKTAQEIQAVGVEDGISVIKPIQKEWLLLSNRKCPWDDSVKRKKWPTW